MNAGPLHHPLTSGRGPARRWRPALVVLCCALVWFAWEPIAEAVGDDQAAQAVVDRVARQFISRTSIATVKMEVTKQDQRREVWMQYWALGEAKILLRVRQPPLDAGTAILKVGAKTWVYLPKAKRTVEMPGSMMASSWMGSDLTLNDLVNQSRLTSDYAVALSFTGQRNGIAVTDYTLTPKPEAAVVWGKIVLEVRQADQMPLWQHYYDEDGALVREMTFSEYQTVSGRLVPTRLVMRPAPNQTGDQTGVQVGEPAAGEQTVVTYFNLVFDQPISDETFAVEALKP